MTCPRCRGATYRVHKLGLAWAKHRMQALNFWSSRLQYIEPRVLKLMNDATKNVADAKAKARSRLQLVRRAS